MRPAEELAKQMHEAYERLAPKFGWETQKKSRKPWEEVPEENRNLMIAVITEVFTADATKALSDETQRDVSARKASALVLQDAINEMRGFLISPSSNPAKRLFDMVHRWEKTVEDLQRS